ncbi:MAG: gluconate 2-dehydrogenase subunit 3 family protein [Myxococcota bacterium]
MRRRALLALGALSPAMLALQRLSLSPLGAPERSAASGIGKGSEEASATRVLNAAESELMLRVVERMVETGEPDAPDPGAIGTLEAIEGALAPLDETVLDALRLALRLVDLWPLLFELRFARFRSLSPAQRDASLERWRRSRFAERRRVFYALRNLALLGYWSQPETWPLIGYGGPWIRRAP